MKKDSFKLALDKGSARSYDEFGRLHVKIANISKANVCPYLGEEIPGYEQLGLDPKRIYQLLRDPKELEKAAPSSNNIQLMSLHIAVSADEPQKETVAGSTGTDGAFNAPYLQNSLVVWDKDDIKNIEDGSAKELSCGYAYRPDMTPGTYEGTSYDGVMRDIIFNHVALVPEGRVGHDVIVGDSKPSFMEKQMSKKALSTKAAMVKGAVMAHLGSKLAADAAPKINALLQGVRQATWNKGSKETIAKGVVALAKDAKLDEVIELLDKLDGEEIGGEDEEDPGKSTKSEKEEDKPEALDNETSVVKELEALLAKLKGGGAKDEDDADAMDEPPESKPEGANVDPKNGKNKKEIPEAKDEEEKVDKKAMDAAIKKASDAAAKDAENRTIARLRSISEAEEHVRPYVGKLTAMDSADAVYKAALDLLKVDVTDAPAAAYKHILLAQPVPGAQPKPRQAHDSASVSNITDYFENANRLAR